jgi:hypothetical protein
VWRIWPAPSATVVAMTERDDYPATTAGRPITTGEFRATPDVSANTAQFQAFAEGGPETRSWQAPGRSPARMATLVIGAILVIAIVAIIIATVG